MNFIKNNWRLLLVVLSVNIIVLLIEGLLARYLWVSWNGRVTFGPLNGYIFLWVSIGIGSIAIVNSTIASLIASNSLKLTRATTRPFLTYLVKDIVLDESNKAAFLMIVVSNKGNLPAEKPLLQILQVSYRSEATELSTDTGQLRNQIPAPSKLKELLKDKDKKSDATYFPGETRNFVFTFGPDALKEYQKSQCIAIGIVIFYQSMQRDYETIRWFFDDKKKPPEARFKSIPEKDYFK